jgi:hypothetical protein
VKKKGADVGLADVRAKEAAKARAAPRPLALVCGGMCVCVWEGV